MKKILIILVCFLTLDSCALFFRKANDTEKKNLSGGKQNNALSKSIDNGEWVCQKEYDEFYDNTRYLFVCNSLNSKAIGLAVNYTKNKDKRKSSLQIMFIDVTDEPYPITDRKINYKFDGDIYAESWISDKKNPYEYSGVIMPKNKEFFLGEILKSADFSIRYKFNYKEKTAKFDVSRFDNILRDNNLTVDELFEVINQELF